MIFSAYVLADLPAAVDPLRSVKSVSPRDANCPELKSVTSHPRREKRSSSASRPRPRQSSGDHSANRGRRKPFRAKNASASAMQRLISDRFIALPFSSCRELCDAARLAGRNFRGVTLKGRNAPILCSVPHHPASVRARGRSSEKQFDGASNRSHDLIGWLLSRRHFPSMKFASLADLSLPIPIRLLARNG